MECPVCHKDAMICTCIKGGKATLYCNNCDEEREVHLWEAVRIGVDIGGSKNKGKWLLNRDFETHVVYTCSVCGVPIACYHSRGEGFRLNNYCFNCGAKMDLGEYEEYGSIDAVPVVRCKDCKFRNGAPGQPNIICWNMKDDDFCSYGEKAK